ncbi:MAG TPA: exodeoxyribonuclease V subunit gamma [Thermoleophilaceae bacterium]|nr:exodeoxyribonuclease V subunit gamma [Thermoleophilaceae bacterium]
MLHVHRAERADGLVEALRGCWPSRRTNPFAPDVVCVPTRGMVRWLAQRMSDRLGATPGRGDGVCANVAFPSPRRLVGDAVATASGIEADADPWLPEPAVWALLEVVDACLHEPWLHTLAAHLGGADGAVDPARRARRLATLRHLADLFDRYALHRPDMVRAWAAGRDVDGAGGELEVMRALAAGRETHLCLLHPWPALWREVGRQIAGRSPVVRRRDDPTRSAAANRLLASWVGTRARCSSSWARPSTSTITTPSITPTTRYWPACRPPCAPTASSRLRCPSTPMRGPSWPPRTKAFRSTPATAVPARSRCFPTRSCTARGRPHA